MRRRVAEPLLELSSGGAVKVAGEMVARKLLVALVKGSSVTLDSLKLVASDELSSGALEASHVPCFSNRVGAATTACQYATLGSKYLLVLSGALTPRSVYSAVARALDIVDVVRLAPHSVIAAPNATLKGALKRMVERSSTCAFIARAVDAWTALRAVVEGSSGVLKIKTLCTELADSNCVTPNHRGLADTLSERGFGALVVSGHALLVDVSLHRALLSLPGQWLPLLEARR